MNLEAACIEYAPMVHQLAAKARRAHWRSEAHEDLVQEGFIGLIDAHRRFRPEVGAPFSRFAMIRVGGAIRDGARRMSPGHRNARTSAFTSFIRVSLEGIDPPDAGAPVDELAEDAWWLRRIFEAMHEALTDKERFVLVLRYFEGFSQMQIANVFDVSEPRASQLVSEAMRHLRAALGGEEAWAS